MPIVKIPYMLCAAVTLAGCTTELKSTYVKSDNKDVTPGQLYRLPRTTFDVTATFEISSCKADTTTGVMNIGYSVDVKVDELTKGDPAATYALDVEALDAFTKITSMNIATTESGLLTTAGAHASDQSASLITDSVKTIANVVVAAAMPTRPPIADVIVRREAVTKYQSINGTSISLPLKGRLSGFERIEATAAKETYEKLDPCRNISALSKSVSEKQEAVKKLNQARKTIDGLSADLTEQKALLSYYQEGIKFHTTYKNTERAKYFTDHEAETTEAMAKSTSLLKAARETADSNAQAEAELVTAKNKLRAISSYTVMGDLPAGGVETSSLAISTPVLARMLDVPASQVSECKSSDENHYCVTVIPKIQILLSTLGSRATPASTVTDINKDGRNGIFYRLPGEARLRVCQTRCDSDDRQGELFNRVVSVAQLGTIGNITLKNRIFADNEINLVFHPNGTPQSLTFESKARSDAARQSALGASENYLTMVKDRNAAVRNANSEAQADRLSALQAEKSQLDEQQQILNSLQTQPANSLQNQINVNRQKIELLKVQRQLVEEQRLTDEALKN